ncbi:MAG: hypothetical protein ACHQ4H_14945 [Ktedonobacterales bacterium]
MRAPHQIAIVAWLCALLLLLLLALLGGCAFAPRQGTHSSTANGTPTTATPTNVTPIEITDLGAFRARLTAAFTTDGWNALAPLLSPQLTFQGPDTGGAQALTPAATHDLSLVYAAQQPWSPAPQSQLDRHACYGGTTPSAEQIGFDGHGGYFVLLGLARWQGYWVVSWAFADPLGSADACNGG